MFEAIGITVALGLTTASSKARLNNSALNSSGTRKPPASPEPSFNAFNLVSLLFPIDLS